jgi:hypothetical protein
VDEYRKVFTHELEGNTAALRKAHDQIKVKFAKMVPIDNAIFSMVVMKLPSPIQS